MQRSWLVTTALCLAATLATLQGTRGDPQPTAAPTPKAAPAAPAATQPGKVTKDGPMAAGHLTLPDQLTWEEAPPALPRGARAAILNGDPAAKAGTFTVRIKMPDGYKVMPHTHPTAEYVTVLSGALRVGMAREWNDAAMTTLPAGGFAHMPPNTAHYVQARGATTIQVSGQAPFVLTYVNPADDPRKSASKPTTSASR